MAKGKPKIPIRAGVGQASGAATAHGVGHSFAAGVGTTTTDAITISTKRLRAVIREELSATPAPAPSAPKKGNAWQVDRVLRALPACYQNGIDGILDRDVRKKVAEYLLPEIKTKGLAVPKRDAMNRAIRLYRIR